MLPALAPRGRIAATIGAVVVRPCRARIENAARTGGTQPFRLPRLGLSPLFSHCGDAGRHPPRIIRFSIGEHLSAIGPVASSAGANGSSYGENRSGVSPDGIGLAGENQAAGRSFREFLPFGFGFRHPARTGGKLRGMASGRDAPPGIRRDGSSVVTG